MNDPRISGRRVEQLPTRTKAKVVSEELSQLLDAVRGVAPNDAKVTFEFDGSLHLHVHLHKLEDVARLEVLLPTLCGGIFSEVQRGLVDHHPFLHRLTALVDR